MSRSSACSRASSSPSSCRSSTSSSAPGRPYSAVLGKAPACPGYHDIARYPDADQVPGLLILRWSAPLFFANANQFRDRVRELVEAADPPPRWVLVAAEPITDIDTTAGDMLEDLDDELNARGILLAFAEMQSAVRRKIERYELLDMSHAALLPHGRGGGRRLRREAVAGGEPPDVHGTAATSPPTRPNT